ncbi:MAG: hypothetical protein J0652_09520 [Desulfobulbaceae bacterium]|nr:hypothetical protein [Desulfobulbaceae bacterium]
MAVGFSGQGALHRPRYHALESGLQKTVKRAVAFAGIDKKASCHTLR